MVNDIEIVKMTEEHLDGVLAVENLSFKIPWSRNAFLDELLKNDLAIYHIALSKGKVVGYGGFWKIFDEAHITNIAVHPEFRRCGVASALMERILQICQYNNIRSITLEVKKSNIPAQKLYEKYDFKIEGIRKGYYSDTGEDALIMWRHDD